MRVQQTPSPRRKRTPAAGTDKQLRPDPGSRVDQLLDVASDMFLVHGFARTSVSAIAREAHASKETYYSRFPQKELLFRAVIRRRMDQFTSEFDLLLPDEIRPFEALSRFGARTLDRLLSKEAVALHRIVMTEAHAFPELAQIFLEQGPERIIDGIARYYTGQIARGTLRSADPRKAARTFYDLLTAELTTQACMGVLKDLPVRLKTQRVAETVQSFLGIFGPT